MAPKSSDVIAGTNATGSQYNDLREDTVNLTTGHNHDGVNSKLIVVSRAFSWYLEGGSIVDNEVGAKYIVPQAMTVVSIRHKSVSGTATIRVQKDTTDVDASISVTSSVANETGITSPALTAGQVLTLDITAASSLVGLTVIVECTQP